jgi:Zn-dependent M32 family carboxypeptidase
MGGVYSTNNNDKYESLLNKYNKMKSNYETEKVYSSSLKENIENLENKIMK